jgi:hypothetical protein
MLDIASGRYRSRFCTKETPSRNFLCKARFYGVLASSGCSPREDFVKDPISFLACEKRED